MAHKYENGVCVYCGEAQPEGAAQSVSEPAQAEETAANQTGEAAEEPAEEAAVPDNAIYISFDGNGAASGSMEAQAFEPGTSQNLSLNAFVRPGYRFVGWDYMADGSGMGAEPFLDGEEVTLNADITLYAQWAEDPEADGGAVDSSETAAFEAPLQYTITITDGTNTKSEQRSKGSPYSVPDFPKDFISPDNKTFNYWEDSEGNPYYSGNVIDSIESDLTLTAQWKDGYTISFENDDPEATGAMSSLYVADNEEISLPGNGFALKNHKFIGWSETSKGEKQYDDEQQITPDHNMVLYAVWERTHYTISFNPNGGYGSMEDQTAPKDGSVILADNAYTKAGKTFIGWSTNISVDAVTYHDGETIQMKDLGGEDLTLYAIWRDPVKITYYSNNPDGTNTTATQIIGNGEKTPLDPNSFTVSGMTFDHWSIQPDGSGTKYQDK